MLIFLIIASCLLWIAAFAALPKRILLGPALSFCALLTLSFAKNSDGYSILNLSQASIISWLALTLVMMFIIILQNPAIRQQSRGLGYLILGGLAGMAVGLLAFSFASGLQILYACTLIGTAIGIFLGMLIFSYTPDGRAIAPGSGNFFRYLLAKGFPTLITIGQLALATVILIVGYAR